MTTISETRQSQILSAAAVCFARRGFHQATVQDICKETGLSPGSIYRYFRSKDDIIAALVDEDRVRNIERITAVRQQADVFAAFEKLADETLASLDDPVTACLYAEINAEALRNPIFAEQMRLSDTAIRDALAETLRLAQARKAIDPGLDATQAAEVLVAVVNGLSWRKSLYPRSDASNLAGVFRTLLARFLWPETSPHLTLKNSTTKLE